MELTLQTFQRLLKKYLKYQFSLYPMKSNAATELQIAMMQLHQSNTDTMFSLKEIVSLKNVNDVYCLSRSMFESVVNMGVLSTQQINGGAERFMDFQYLEAYRIFDHLKQVEPDFVSKVYGPKTIEIMTEGRNAFVSKYGNLNNWCGLDLLARIRLVDRHFPPTCSTKNFFEYLYCQVYRKGSGATHRTSTGLGRSILWTKSRIANLNLIEPTPNIDHLVFAGFHSLIVYLGSIRFIGRILCEIETESYYQKETARIVSGKE